MSGYGYSWLIVFAAGVCGLAALYGLIRRWSSAWGKVAVLGFAGVLFLAPAGVPNYPGQYAPAFIVYVFEAFFQTRGAPGGAMTVLLTGWLVTAFVMGAVYVLWRRRNARQNGPNQQN